MRERESRGGGLQVCGVLGVLMLTSLTGCGWLFGSGPSEAAKARPGAERQVAPSNALQSAGTGRQYDAAVTPVDETRSGPKIGSIIPDKGGQKAQLEAAAKEAAERDKQAREEREKAAAAEAERKAKEAANDPKGAKGADTKGADAKGTITTPPADQPPTQPAAPPPAPITATPVPPPPTAPSADQKS